MSSKTGDLDSRQAEAVADRSSSLVVTGPAGSGRTTALTARFAALVDQGVEPERILVITLDDAGADRLRSTIESRLERPWEELSVLGTTGLAMRILRDAAAGADIAPDPSLLGRADRLALLADALDRLTIEAHDLGRDPLVLLASLIQRIDRLEEESIDNAAFSSWARKLPKSTPDEIAFARREAEFAAVWAEHDRILTERSARSGSGALRDAVALLERNPALQRAIATSFEELIVDGAEDFDHLAWRCVQMLRPPQGRLVLFSDPAQGFKRIRGAFGDRVSATAAAGATVIELDGVHRGHSEIEFWQATTERAQAQAVASEVERLVMRDGVDPGQIAVIVSSVVREAPAVEVALEERALPNRVSSPQAFFQRAEIRDLLAWLRLLTDPADGAAVIRAMARAPIGLASADIARCSTIARKRRLDMVSALAAAIESPQIPPEARDRIHGFLRLHALATRAIDALKPDLFIHRLIERLGLRSSLAYSASPQAAERLRALATFGELASAHVRRDPQATARDFARHIVAIAAAGVDDVGIPIPDGGSPAVEILGMDAVRDREWEHVFVIGLEAGRLPAAANQLAEPLPESILPEQLPGSPDEARSTAARNLNRLAMSRARNRLVLCHARSGSRGETLHPSAFAEEVRLEAAGEWIERETELFAPNETLQATYRILRDELLEVVESTGDKLLELRLDTGEDIDRAVVRFLELLKLSALTGRPDGHGAADSLAAVNERLRAAASDNQRAALETSALDRYILEADRDEKDRERALAARSEPSLEAFLPRRGEGVALSASDIETYRTCPLRYKFARVMRVPQDPTTAQRFGIVMHQVLERWHRGPGGSEAQLLGLFEQTWRRSGLGDGERERQLKTKARTALTRYLERNRERNVEAIWLERPFTFRIGPHILRGRVDRVDRHADGAFELIDYKTSFPKTAEQLRDDIQLTVYSIGARDAWKLDAPRRSYWYVLDDDRVEVPGEIDRDEIEATVHEVAEGILSQGFEPSPSFSACSTCDWQLACPAAES